MSRNYDKYYTRMEAGMAEKVDYILNYLPADYSGRILDFGCANGKFIEILRHFLPNASFIGIDNRPEIVKLLVKENSFDNVSYCGSIDEIPIRYSHIDMASGTFIKDSRFDVIIFSSVLHEVFSFMDKPMTVIQAAKEADIIFIRDMLYTETNQGYKFPRFKLEKDFIQSKTRDLKEPKDIAEYMMKVIYHENWEEELKEDYFSVPYKEIDEYLTGSRFRKAYECNYMNEWLRNKVNFEQSDRVDLATFTGTTHTKRIYVKR